jgi:hypothetical protein
MNIDRYNCEAAFLDYYEKNLSPVEVAEVLFFLEDNSDLKPLFESYKAIYLEHERIKFPSKNSLKKKFSSEEIEKILSSAITKTNCEQFFVASAEGLLSAGQKEKLNLFLFQNPELKNDFELFQKCKLFNEKIQFENKDLLKKEIITKQNKEEYFIRAIEKDLNIAEQKTLKLFLQKNPVHKQEFELFQKTILVSETISFQEKHLLKKKERKPIFVSLYSQRTVYYVAAASVLLLVGLFFFFRNNDTTNKQLFANKTNLINKKAVEANKENVENPIKENEQKPVPRINETGNIKHQTSNTKRIHIKENVASNKFEIKKEETKLQPILSDDVTEEKLIAQIEEPQLPMMQEEKISAQSNQPENKINIVNESPSVASVKNSKNKSDNYQTLSAFVTKKVRSLLGVKNTNPCADSEKLGWWDLAMAAKNGIQKITGTKIIDVDKKCDDTGNKVEYVFAAGNFEFSKNAAK